MIAYEFGEIGGDVDRASQRSCARARGCGAPRCGRPGMMPVGPGKAPSTGRLCRTDGGSDPPARQGPRTGGCAHGIGGGTGGGVNGSIPIATSQKLATASEITAIGTQARAYSRKLTGAPIAAALSATSRVLRLPLSSRFPARLDSSASEYSTESGG